jgi:hypothetical protein
MEKMMENTIRVRKTNLMVEHLHKQTTIANTAPATERKYVLPLLCILFNYLTTYFF